MALGMSIRSPLINMQGPVVMSEDLTISNVVSVGDRLEVGVSSGSVGGVEVLKLINDVTGNGIGNCGLSVTFKIALNNGSDPVNAGQISVYDADPADSSLKSRLTIKTLDQPTSGGDMVERVFIDASGVTLGANSGETVLVRGTEYVGGALNVTGGANISGSVTLGSNASQMVNVGGALNVGGSVSVTGGANISGSLSVTGGGNIGGSISVTGGANISGSVTLGSNTSQAVNVGGALNVGGSVSVTGSGNVGGTLNVTGGGNIGGSLNVTGGANISGSVTLGSNSSQMVLVRGNEFVGGDLSVTGGGNIGGSLSVTGSGNIGGSLNVTGGANISGSVTLGSNASQVVYIGGDLSVTGGGNIGGSLSVTGGANISGSVTLGSNTSQVVYVGGALNVTGSEIIGGNLSVTGALNVTGGGSISGAVVLGSSFSDTVSVAGPMLFQAGAAPFLKRRALTVGGNAVTTGDVGAILAITTGGSSAAYIINLPTSQSGWTNGTHCGYFYIVQETASVGTVNIVPNVTNACFINGFSTTSLTLAAFSNKMVMVYAAGGNQWWARGSGVM